ncbi:MAG: hypothetical protein ACRDL6_10115 [Solirubrobacterales bacterium]
MSRAEDRGSRGAVEFITVRELVPGERPAGWDGLNAPPPGTGILWVDVDTDRAELRSVQQILSRLCPGLSEERVTDLFMVELEAGLEDGGCREVPVASVVRSFEGWLITCWHEAGVSRVGAEALSDRAAIHAAVEERWRELGAGQARTAGDLASIFFAEVGRRCGRRAAASVNGRPQPLRAA